jgi:signal transduction histidine kinase
MKLFSTVLRRKRGVILFVAAFMLPLLFVVVVGIDTFSKRQKSTRNLLESNLWLSGRSALEQLEILFIKLEAKQLDTRYFNNLLKQKSPVFFDTTSNTFLVDQDYQILYPKIIKDQNSNFLEAQKNWNSNYRKYRNRAEIAEFNQKNYSNAIKNYQICLDLAKSVQQKALVIEGIARSQKADKNYKSAIRNYKLLKKKYNQTKNRSGHPYGITASLQLYAIGKVTGQDVFSRDSLLLIYQNLNDRHWLINPSSYFFFKAEYESILNLTDISKESRFEKMQNFNQFLTDFVIPSIKERRTFSGNISEPKSQRIFISTEKSSYLVSFKKMQTADPESYYYTGICWNIDSLLNKSIVPELARLQEKTGLELRLINSKNIDPHSDKTFPIPKESLSLSFNNIPFPWTLIAIQPGYEKLELDAKTQMIIYGLLVIIIIILMMFAVFVLFRDISRETDSMLLQTEFVHNVSHELKTPLSLIRLYGETLLIKDKLPESDRKEGLQIITKESERLSYMINNILDFSKIEMGRKEFDLKPGNLKEVVLNTLDSYRYHFIKKGFSIEEEIDPNIPIVLFDRNAVEGILINLFSNAIKFSNDKKAMLVRIKQSAEEICLEVSDKGIGIPSDELPNIFNRFYRVKSTTDFEARGSGLGLTLVKHAVDAHHWQINVKSKPGQGSSFIISIPKKAKKE